jgi:hypothetical protein
MMTLDEDAVRRRALELWKEQGEPYGQNPQLLARARAEIRREFEKRTRDAGDYPHSLHAPLEIQEALTPGESHKPGGYKWSSNPGERGW